MIEGLKSKLQLYEHTSVASLGWDKVRFMKPIFPDDAVHVKVRFTDKRDAQAEQGEWKDAAGGCGKGAQNATNGDNALSLIRVRFRRAFIDACLLLDLYCRYSNSTLGHLGSAVYPEPRAAQ